MHIVFDPNLGPLRPGDRAPVTVRQGPCYQTTGPMRPARCRRQIGSMRPGHCDRPPSTGDSSPVADAQIDRFTVAGAHYHCYHRSDPVAKGRTSKFCPIPKTTIFTTFGPRATGDQEYAHVRQMNDGRPKLGQHMGPGDCDEYVLRLGLCDGRPWVKTTGDRRWGPVTEVATCHMGLVVWSQGPSRLVAGARSPGRRGPRCG